METRLEECLTKKVKVTLSDNTTRVGILRRLSKNLFVISTEGFPTFSTIFSTKDAKEVVEL